MRFARRRTADRGADAVEETASGQDAEPGPPEGAPEAVFAGVLDDRRLWVAVADQPGSLALRDPDTGQVHGPSVRGDAGRSQPGFLDARLDLRAAFAIEGERCEVVLVPGDGGPVRQVWAPPLDDVPGAAPGPVPDDGPRFELHRSSEGLLSVRMTERSAGPVLVSLEVTAPHAVRLTLEGAATGDRVAFVRDEDTLATWPVATGTGGEVVQPGFHAVVYGGAHVVLDVTDLPDEAWAQPGAARVVVTRGGEPVRRRGHDVDPSRGVVMPELEAAAGRVRLRWSPDGRLLARVLPGDGGEDA